MTVLADLPFEPNVIIVLVLVVISAVKALIEKRQQKKLEDHQPSIDYYDDDEDDGLESINPLELYEAELQRQREVIAQESTPATPPPLQPTPPPLTSAPAADTFLPYQQEKPIRPQLTEAEKKALENLQRSTPRKKRQTETTNNRVRKLLSSPTAAREALILSEVLAKPKSLR